MLKSSGAMAAATMASRLLGMVREIVYANFMGTGWVAGAFKLAFMIPNLFRRLLGEGALTAAFIPIFKEKEKTAGEAEMWKASNAVISGLLVVTSVIVGVAMLGIALALSVHEFEARTDLMLRLLLWMFPYMLLVCVAAVFIGMLNARGHFFIPAMGAAVLNVVLIASVLLLAPAISDRLEEQIFGLAVGVLVAGVAQAGFQLPILFKEGFRYRWVSPWKNETVRRVVLLMIPGTLGVAAYHINVLVVMGIAFFVDPTILASFDYAVRLMELPQGVFGVSMATFLLPTLSGLAAEKKYPEYRTTLAQGADYLIFVNLIASVLLIVLAEPIVRLLFERGKFTAESTLQVALAVKCLAPGLVVFSLANILARAFYALGDIRTPMKVSIFCLVLNIVIAVILIGPFRQGGLGAANSLSSTVQVGLLLYALRIKIKTLEWAGVRRTLLCLLAPGVLAGIAAWWLHAVWAQHFGHAGLMPRIGAVFAPALLAGVLYWGLALWLKVPGAADILRLVWRR
jgi:putative peptidoglycan lipid II flippase